MLALIIINIKHKRISLFTFFLFFALNIKAQNKNTIVYFENNTIAFKKQNDSIFFYNSSGSLIKIIDLKNKKAIPLGFPKEIQNIIYDDKIPERIEVLEETFHVYLYTQKYSDAGTVLCSEQNFYNNLGLKTGCIEICQMI